MGWSEEKMIKDLQYYKFCLYGFFKNLRFFEPFLILFFLEKGLSFSQIGVLYAVREISRNILEIPAGVFADMFGKRRSMIYSFVFYIASFMVFYQSRQFLIFIIAMLLYALGDSFRTGTHKAMIFDYLKLKNRSHQKTQYYGHTRSWSQIGSAVSSLLAGVVVFSQKNYESVFLYSIIPYVLDLVLLASYPAVLDGKRASANWSSVKHTFLDVFKEFRLSFSDKITRKAIANTAIYSAYYRALKDYLQPVLKQLALAIPLAVAWNENQRSAIIIAVIYFIVYLLSAFAARESSAFVHRIKSESKALNLSLIFGGISGVLVGFWFLNHLLWMAVIFYIAMFLIENLRKPIGMSYVSAKVDSQILATALSVESQLKSLFTAFFALILGFLSDKLGLAQALISVAIILIVLTALLRLPNKISN